MLNPPFQKTECSCFKDQASCKEQPGHLLPGQMQEILTHLKVSIEEAGKYFWNSPGMVLARMGRLFRMRTITPRFENGHCVFFKEGLCSIHPVAPFGCRFFDVHMNLEEAQHRSQWGARQILDLINQYQRDRDALPMATHYKGREVI